MDSEDPSRSQNLDGFDTLWDEEDHEEEQHKSGKDSHNDGVSKNSESPQSCSESSRGNADSGSISIAKSGNTKVGSSNRSRTVTLHKPTRKKRLLPDVDSPEISVDGMFSPREEGKIKRVSVF